MSFYSITSNAIIAPIRPPSLQIDGDGFIHFGSHRFSVDELGILLKHLQAIHFPDHSL